MSNLTYSLGFGFWWNYILCREGLIIVRYQCVLMDYMFMLLVIVYVHSV